jgi:hypothetical protein
MFIAVMSDLFLVNHVGELLAIDAELGRLSSKGQRYSSRNSLRRAEMSVASTSGDDIPMPLFL